MISFAPIYQKTKFLPWKHINGIKFICVTVGTLITGVDSIATDVNEQKLTVIGEMDTVAVVKKLKKVGKVDIISVGPAKEEKKEEKKDESKDEKKEEKKEEKQEEKK
jgi:ribosomal protein L12E/L44/L45/RPP1/RPP2